ncbi:sperm acrosome membrane-associated protein 6 isoform X10 [Pteropus alecto]|uniref:sperm acrosome membrane-associated protein 6 isoform X9 n=2 Tax=Pteropus alecto TaxID=9402 RepID=UPI000D533CB8|nr:sperm acrosome membrane-associated protein 6 isoform X9 [Pteropus alecto]XP_024903806.1 sperm acrosome membrane-associated protein 6 isoform X10 [Pteropus alecto]
MATSPVDPARPKMKGFYDKASLRPPGSFEVAFPDAAEKMRKVIMQLKEVQACIPPCGLQEVSRRFRCRGCYSTVCDLPLDCPVQDVTVTRGDQAMFSCTVNFQLPKEEITYSWRFAGGGLRTQDLTYFREMPRAQGYLARIRPVQPTHRGTFSCVITHDQRALARLYFFLNVTGPPPRGETKLQASFREVLRWAPREAEVIESWRPSLGELLARPEALTPSNQCLLAAIAALASAGVTLLAWKQSGETETQSVEGREGAMGASEKTSHLNEEMGYCMDNRLSGAKVGAVIRE